MIKKFEGEDVISNLELAYKINEIIDSVNKIKKFIENEKFEGGNKNGNILS